eukprot:gnl/TRDRNA2_/TRDRNA2_189081_c0_seq1.p1 gnl/TRDRNA2_/TRDRNA2_189081_c0~~gnl/TRDRNA2_/TRDRNA2_189081_c0_seq1.p1  ORF type:complete len:440 (+),score=42.06 gnl/TRDRNA2_/TRDRNA2_189081_c0_seq1:62-1381(+)
MWWHADNVVKGYEGPACHHYDQDHTHHHSHEYHSVRAPVSSTNSNPQGEKSCHIPRFRQGPEGHPSRSRLFTLWQTNAFLAHVDVQRAQSERGVSRDGLHREMTREISRGSVSVSGTPRNTHGRGSFMDLDRVDTSGRLSPGKSPRPDSQEVTLRPSLTRRLSSWQEVVMPEIEQELVQRGPPEFVADDARRLKLSSKVIDKETLAELDKFKACCIRKYGNLCRAWRQLLDPGGVGRVSFVQFCKAARLIGWCNVKPLWFGLDADKSGFITLGEWDPVAFRNVSEFREICYKEYGGMDTAFLFGMDRTHSHTVTLQELKEWCNEMEYSGDVPRLFHALDGPKHGFLTLDCLDFLSKWQGERFSKGIQSKEFDFRWSRHAKRKRQEGLRKRASLLGTRDPSITGTPREGAHSPAAFRSERTYSDLACVTSVPGEIVEVEA